MAAPTELPDAIPLFPLGGALLFPDAQLPLHVFEPRYRRLVKDAMEGRRVIGMIQPRGDEGRAPPLYPVGCLGAIAGLEALDDGRFNLILQGVRRFRLVRELDVTTPYRQAQVEYLPEEPDDALGLANRAELEGEARAFADALGYQVDWDALGSLDDETLVHLIAQVAPFDVASKQALLEAGSVPDRAELLVQFMSFQRMLPGGAGGPATFQ
ncbi:MAG: Uncharacterized protein, similar to the N-terminal domain of Lon protease [uncultured Sphingomonadaceae bacterium]|uniref:Uncharacterized protein, similar to the N-terminal domain of Lon protease n=1 Tax=uncultured Sphingomonadaceae bacterium TaxID=169976 RepID=A0A6J4RW89_9SPHN|nr:MAG: Uncharacterized protein, similar to the N-terminal domain of Lon protease [uncultured Sphingomonadaceae bacterium]